MIPTLWLKMVLWVCIKLGKTIQIWEDVMVPLGPSVVRIWLSITEDLDLCLNRREANAMENLGDYEEMLRESEEVAMVEPYPKPHYYYPCNMNENLTIQEVYNMYHEVRRKWNGKGDWIPVESCYYLGINPCKNKHLSVKVGYNEVYLELRTNKQSPSARIGLISIEEYMKLEDWKYNPPRKMQELFSPEHYRKILENREKLNHVLKLAMTYVILAAAAAEEIKK